MAISCCPGGSAELLQLSTSCLPYLPHPERPHCRRLLTHGELPLSAGSDTRGSNGSQNFWEPETDDIQYWRQAKDCQEVQTATATSSETRAEDSITP